MIFLSKIRNFFWRWKSELQPGVLALQTVWHISLSILLVAYVITWDLYTMYTEVTVTSEFCKLQRYFSWARYPVVMVPLSKWIRLEWLWYDAKLMAGFAVFFAHPPCQGWMIYFAGHPISNSVLSNLQINAVPAVQLKQTSKKEFKWTREKKFAQLIE